MGQLHTFYFFNRVKDTFLNRHPEDQHILKEEVRMPIFDMPVCGGCRTCEIACSFHHREEFNPAISSIRILSQEGKIPYRVWLVRKEEDRTMEIPCDGCKDLEEPLCLQFCRKKDELKNILEEFKNSNQGNGSI
jgi:Fe-S-cluster-containing hydrogenase component 2